MKSENGYAILVRFDNNYGWTAVTFPKYAVCYYYSNLRLGANAQSDVGNIYGIEHVPNY